MEVEDLSGGARVRVDPGQISQLLLNLARNAMDAAEIAHKSRHIDMLGLDIRARFVDG